MSYKPSAKVVALPSMTHSLSHLPNMHNVDPSNLHYGALGGAKDASAAKLKQTLQRRDTASTTSGGSSNSQQYYSMPSSRSSGRSDDGDYLMMGKGRKKPL
ncbi:hypothetical protein M422DRAFT_250703 [Sphaerobolus stellatus SS14]|uniref:Uncharacterized protein n=1 Tax=Sphaerobolus stellatus (strain SS14) TaxID=990650 RepID=A0A0C9VG39_SPHS4|nr:hypothetical protein M422DRAFT_250703 [Sphaerobolus stellatus SS14]